MKKSKLITFLLVIVMTLGMAATVLATPTTVTVEIKNTVNGNQLDAYQILSFQVATDTAGNESYNQVSFIDDGYKQIFIDTINQTNIKEGKAPISNDVSPTDIMLYITNNFSTDNNFANELGNALKNHIENSDITATHTMLAEGTSVTFEDTPGYYLILDKTEYNDVHESEVAVMIQAVGSSVSVDLKTSTYTIPDKKVDYDNVQIGDELTYTISFNIPNFSKYEKDATFIITDKMSNGLELVETSFEYTLGGETKTFTAASVISVTEGDSTVTTITIPVKENFHAEDIGKTFTITYKAKVNSNADVDNLGNKVVLQQNDHTLPEVSVNVYSYGIHVFKINEVNEKLEGVEFVLLSKAGDNYDKYYLFDRFDNKYKYFSTTPFSDDNVSDKAKLITNSDGEIEVFGLKAGTYYLKEIKTLDGYNLLTDDIKVVINQAANDKDYIAYQELTVTNTTKIQLPGTGGMGTAVYRITGSVLLLAGGCLFINRKKCNF